MLYCYINSSYQYLKLIALKPLHIIVIIIIIAFFYLKVANSPSKPKFEVNLSERIGSVQITVRSHKSQSI